MNFPAFMTLLLALAGAPPAAAAEPGTVEAIRQSRLRGCEGRSGVTGPLSADARLARAAERVSRGTELGAALAAEGYRPQRAGVVALRGYSGTALGQGLAQHACSTLLNPAWQHLGLHAAGAAAWVVLAEPFSPPPPEDEQRVRAELLQRINQARAQPRRCGERPFAAARPVQLNAALHRAAQAHADDMARHSYFSHTGRDGSQVAQRADRAAYAWRRIGENLAAGQTTAAAAVEGWLASPSHCANLMQPDFSEMGLAYAVNPQSRDGIYWVQVLGTPR